LNSSSAICTVSGDRPASSGSFRILISMLALGVSLCQLSPSSGAALSLLQRRMLPSLLVTSRRWQTAKWPRRSLAMSAVSHSSPERLWPPTRFRNMGTRTLPGGLRMALLARVACVNFGPVSALSIISRAVVRHVLVGSWVLCHLCPRKFNTTWTNKTPRGTGSRERRVFTQCSPIGRPWSCKGHQLCRSTFCVGTLSSCPGPSLGRVCLVILRCECPSAGGSPPRMHNVDARPGWGGPKTLGSRVFGPPACTMLMRDPGEEAPRLLGAGYSAPPHAQC